MASFSPTGASWQRPQALDITPQLATEQPRATCCYRQHRRGRGFRDDYWPGPRPAAWYSTDGSYWASASFTPGPANGSYAQLDWCLPTGSGFIAFGGSTGGGQVDKPVLWGSSDGTSWQALPATFNGLGGAAPVGAETAPLDGVGEGGTTWLGVSGDGDAPTQQWPAPVGGAAAATFTPAGLWSSVDAGTTWQQRLTNGPAFTGNVFAQAVSATYVGQQPIVAGTVDGQLAVWVGTPSTTVPAPEPGRARYPGARSTTEPGSARTVLPAGAGSTTTGTPPDPRPVRREIPRSTPGWWRRLVGSIASGRGLAGRLFFDMDLPIRRHGSKKEPHGGHHLPWRHGRREVGDLPSGRSQGGELAPFPVKSRPGSNPVRPSRDLGADLAVGPGDVDHVHPLAYDGHVMRLERLQRGQGAKRP